MNRISADAFGKKKDKLDSIEREIEEVAKDKPIVKRMRIVRVQALACSVDTSGIPTIECLASDVEVAIQFHPENCRWMVRCLLNAMNKYDELSDEDKARLAKLGRKANEANEANEANG